MKKILLLCSGGMSTSILVNKMKAAAELRGIEVQVEAHGIPSLKNHIGHWDCCLVGPQVRFERDNIAKALEIPTEVINMMDYGMANGEKVLDHALSLID